MARLYLEAFLLQLSVRVVEGADLLPSVFALADVLLPLALGLLVGLRSG